MNDKAGSNNLFAMYQMAGFVIIPPNTSVQNGDDLTFLRI
jgi:hypothetical protein